MRTKSWEKLDAVYLSSILVSREALRVESYIRADTIFRCPACTGQVAQEEEDDYALYRIDGETVEEMRKICYLADLLDTEGS